MSDIGDLAAEMEVQQMQAVGHSARFQLFERAYGFAGGEAELRAVAG
jgi:hypothetical protein